METREDTPNLNTPSRDTHINGENGTSGYFLSVRECLVIWRAQFIERRWWVTATDFMALDIERSQAYACFALLAHKAAQSQKKWGRVSYEGSSKLLVFHFDDNEWDAIEELLQRTKYNKEVVAYGRRTTAHPDGTDDSTTRQRPG